MKRLESDSWRWFWELY